MTWRLSRPTSSSGLLRLLASRAIARAPVLPLALPLALLLAALAPAADTIDLGGRWSFRLDPERVGVRQRWFDHALPETIRLPGSTDEQGFGREAAEPERTRLTRSRRYVGPAWYQREIEIPPSWAGRRVELFLERAMWESRAWLDGRFAGAADSLCVPHRFDLSELATAGRHRLTLRIDNRLRVNLGHEPPRPGAWSRMWTMALTDESQTIWNGAIGRIELRARPPAWIERVEIYPELARKRVRVVAFVRSRIGAVEGTLSVSASCAGQVLGPVTAGVRTKDPGGPSSRDPLSPPLEELAGGFLQRRAAARVELALALGEGARLWDEFSPSLYRLRALLSAEREGKAYRDELEETFGLRELRAAGGRLELNGRAIFLRGNQDNCVHPRTGYPPMDERSWLSFLGKHRAYGLNCIRFHSWCPPEAAFDAADELGLLLHVENPLWDGHGDVGALPERAAFLRREAERIRREHGNHPSFCFWSMGNELGSGRDPYLRYLVDVLRREDPRHLYTATSHPADPARDDDFFVSASGRGPARGLRAWHGRPGGDYRSAIEGFRRPFVAHEIGQWTSFPDFTTWFDEARYTGPLEARYIGILKRRFESHHPLARARDFARASGALQLLLYKEEIEAMLRTPGLDGFHLNGLQDYPGEGIALIGMLDALGDSKGIASPEEFRRFCSETVPLVRLERWCWRSGERFEARVEARHHGAAELGASRWRWRISTRAGEPVREGSLGPLEVPTGALTPLGNVETRLPPLEEASELTLEVRLEGGRTANAWRFWVYPPGASVETPAGVLLARAWSDEAEKTLRAGGRVLLLAEREAVRKSVDLTFWTIFWGRGLFGDRMPRPMGILCDPRHGALARFATREHSDWQWHDLLTGAFAIELDDLPFAFEPIVHVIDDFNLSQRLGALLEARVGEGRLLVSTLNLGASGHRSLPQRQMLSSLLAYAGGERFQPRASLPLDRVRRLFRSVRTAWQEARAGREPRAGEPLFVEDFRALEGGGSGTQVGTGRRLRHSARLPGWRSSGFHALHAVQCAGGSWALQVLAAGEGGGDNSLALITPIEANEKGREYRVSFEAGPTVWEMPEQATRAGDRFAIELLRPDGSALARHVVAPGAWAAREAFTPGSFTYRGDGGGAIRLRIAPLAGGATRFTGAIGRLRVTRAAGGPRSPSLPERATERAGRSP